MNIGKKQIALFIVCIITYTSFAQNYISWDEVATKKFGKEIIYSLKADKSSLNGNYKISEKSGAYADITFKNGKIDGSYVSYDFEGNKEGEANYKEGKIEGKQISYFQNGDVQEETFYINGLKDGTWKIFNKKGEQIATEHYKNDKKDGKWVNKVKNLDENITLIRTEYYNEGKAIGTWEERIVGGNVRSEKKHSTPTDYVEKVYFPNGKLSKEIQVKDHRKNGISSFFNAEGLLQHKINYENDNVVYQEKYFENGGLKSKTSFKYGKVNGPFEEYNEDGIKIIEGTRKETYKEGIWKIYEGRKGRLSSAIMYTNGKPNGSAKFYDHSSKTITREGQYLHGKQHGVWKHYDPSGELTKEVAYDKGRQISEKKYN